MWGSWEVLFAQNLYYRAGFDLYYGIGLDLVEEWEMDGCSEVWVPLFPLQ